ncbi:MAG: hypothetical protein K2F69_02955 [Bacteroidaceae bacterium]|nr:hypothetical protein [Bacteroidaceae bacterium]
MRTFLLSLALSAGSIAFAQGTELQKYAMLPDPLVEVFLDHVQAFPSTTISMGLDQYYGQTDSKGSLYGFGRYVRADGVQVFGLFREGKLIQGITLLSASASVGDATHYANYNLTTGQLDYVFQGSHRQLFDTRALRGNKFLSLTYVNGDQYVGETLDGKRHGLGIYFYANGDIWFGVYQDNVRKGYGATFTIDDHLIIGKWNGEEAIRETDVSKIKRKR